MTRLVPFVAVWLALGCVPPCETGRLCVIAGNGELGFDGDGPATEVRLASPTSVLIDADGQVVIVDYSNMRLRRIEPDDTLTTLVGNGIHAYSEVGSDRLDTPLENPIDAAFGPDGLLYILPQHEGRVIRINEQGVVERYVGTGHLADGGDGGDALDATMGYGGGLAFAEDGTLFIADSTFSRIRRRAPDGTMSTVLGVGSAGAGEPGYGPEVAIRSPERLVVDDHNGRLLVTDTQNHRVLAVDLATLDTTVIAGTGEPGYSGDGGSATSATLRGPVGLAVSGDVVLIADLDNDALRAVVDGQIDTIAGGLPTDKPRQDAPAADFPLRRPAGMAVDGSDLVIAERGGQRVLRWTGGFDAL